MTFSLIWNNEKRLDIFSNVILTLEKKPFTFSVHITSIQKSKIVCFLCVKISWLQLEYANIDQNNNVRIEIKNIGEHKKATWFSALSSENRSLGYSTTKYTNPETMNQNCRIRKTARAPSGMTQKTLKLIFIQMYFVSCKTRSSWVSKYLQNLKKTTWK